VSAAWLRLGVRPSERLSFAHAAPIESLSLVRAKIHCRSLLAYDFLLLLHAPVALAVSGCRPG
jgi:hypothetical protein